MPIFITPKTCMQASKIELDRTGWNFQVTIVTQPKKYVHGRFIGRKCPRIEKKEYPATDYNRNIILKHFGRYDIL